MENLRKLADYEGPSGPVVIIIMDGVGIAQDPAGDMVSAATKPHLDWLDAHAVSSRLKAHGPAVGMPDESDMGNSEVGHNAIGAGRIFKQGAGLVNHAIETRALFEGPVWKELVDNCLEHNSALHFIGLLSDGNVHTHITHLEAMLNEAADAGIEKARVHTLLDGRDVPPQSATEYIDRLESLLNRLNEDSGRDYRIASGGGRMMITMDRYNADWDMVKRGWETHVAGRGRGFGSANEAVETLRKESPGVIDQNLPPFIIVEDGQPVGPILDNDSVILFNFRGDRAIELSRAFEEGDEFKEFERDPMPRVKFAGMMQYDGDLEIPRKYLVSPPSLDRTMGEYLARAGVPQLAISETQKFGHVTYFFNGNRSGKFDEKLEEYIEIKGDKVSFDERPWMKSAEITDKVIESMLENKYRFIRVNYPNGDMVGHTGNCLAVEISVEAVDLAVGRLMEAARKTGAILVVTADHGNADDMFERSKKTGEIVLDPESGQPKAKTSHSLNPVPVYIYDPAGTADIRLSEHRDLGITSLAATCLNLLGFEAPEGYDPGIVDLG